MESTLTIAKLIEVLDVFRKRYGDDIEVHYGTFVDITGIASVSIEKVRDKYDRNYVIPIVVLGS